MSNCECDSLYMVFDCRTCMPYGKAYILISDLPSEKGFIPSMGSLTDFSYTPSDSVGKLLSSTAARLSRLPMSCNLSTGTGERK